MIGQVGKRKILHKIKKIFFIIFFHTNVAISLPIFLSLKVFIEWKHFNVISSLQFYFVLREIKRNGL